MALPLLPISLCGPRPRSSDIQFVVLTYMELAMYKSTIASRVRPSRGKLANATALQFSKTRQEMIRKDRVNVYTAER
jgi:hypothetical protein